MYFYYWVCFSLDREIAEDDVLTLELHSGMLFGFDISSISAIIVTNQYIDYFDNPSGIWQGVRCHNALFGWADTLTRRVQGIGAALAGGSIVGALCAGWISDRIGRRDSIAFGMRIPDRPRNLLLTPIQPVYGG